MAMAMPAGSTLSSAQARQSLGRPSPLPPAWSSSKSSTAGTSLDSLLPDVQAKCLVGRTAGSRWKPTVAGSHPGKRAFVLTSHTPSNRSFSPGGLPSTSLVQRKTPLSLDRGDCKASALATSLPSLALPADAQLWATLSAFLSTFLGYLVICFSLFLKVPQIRKVLRNRSAEGLNRFSFEAECLGYTMALAYCVRKGVPFHIYGELFFILGQALVLMTCIYKYSPPCKWTKVKVPLYIAVAAVLFSGRLPACFLETIYSLQTTMFTMARIPQIWCNFRRGSTGQLSAASYLISVTGCSARLYTSIFSCAPSSMVISSIAGLCTHGTLLLQCLVYGSRRHAKVE